MKELNLEDELLAQYKRAMLLLSDADLDNSIPLAQKAQTLNGITAILTQITKNQEALYSLERVKVIETVLVQVLKMYPEVNQAFLEAYEQALKHAE